MESGGHDLVLITVSQVKRDRRCRRQLHRIKPFSQALRRRTGRVIDPLGIVSDSL